ncbi:hypothetical protein M2326_003263 [Flavobacterium sp. 7A]|nr:hypothetical protein [Flavobacterium sp. 7A]
MIFQMNSTHQNLTYCIKQMLNNRQKNNLLQIQNALLFFNNFDHKSTQVKGLNNNNNYMQVFHIITK